MSEVKKKEAERTDDDEEEDEEVVEEGEEDFFSWWTEWEGKEVSVVGKDDDGLLVGNLLSVLLLPLLSLSMYS